MKTKILTGSMGFIGSKLRDMLISDGLDSEYIFIDRKSGVNPVDINSLYAEGDKVKVGSDVVVEDRNAIELIYHLAGQTSVPKSIVEPLQDVADNIFSMVKMITLFPKARIVYTQSVATEGVINESIKKTWFGKKQFSEAEVSGSPYGLSKLVAEYYLKQFNRDYVICVLPNIYGVGSSGVINLAKALKDNSQKLQIRGDGKQLRTYVSVDDILIGLRQAEGWVKGKYYFGGGEVLSVLDVAKIVGVGVEYVKEVKGEVRDSVIKNTTPNWKPRGKIISFVNK